MPSPLLSLPRRSPAQVLRNTELDQDKRVYPGGYFDPLGLASVNPEQTERLQLAEIKHARLALVAIFGFGVQAGFTGQSPIENLKIFG